MKKKISSGEIQPGEYAGAEQRMQEQSKGYRSRAKDTGAKEGVVCDEHCQAETLL